MHRQFADQIGGAVLAGEIEQRRLGVGVALDEELHQIAHIAAGRGDVGKAGAQRGVGAAPADRDHRPRDQRRARRIIGDGRGRIAAGDDDGAPIAGEIGGNRLDPHQRRQQHVMAARSAARARCARRRLRAGDNEAHDHFSLRKILFENRFPSPPITVEDMRFAIIR